MERPSREEFATRFAAYVSELRETFASRGLRFGRPKDVTAVAKALIAPGALQDDAAAVLRSILYREHEGLSRTELVSIVVVAAGGADLYGSAQEGDAVRQLGAFVNGVRLAMRGNVPVEDEEATPEEVRPDVRSAAETPLRREEVFAEEDVNEELETVAPRAERASVLAGVYSQAQRMSESEQKGGAGGEGTYFLTAKAEKEVVDDPEDSGGETLEHRAAGAYRSWVVGACVLAVLLAVGLVLRYRAAARFESVAREAGPAGGAAAGGPGMPTADAGQSGLAQGGTASGRLAVGSGGGAAGAHTGGTTVAGTGLNPTSEPRGTNAAGAASAPGDHSALTAPSPSASAVGAALPTPPSVPAAEPAAASVPAPKPERAVRPTPPAVGAAAAVVSPAVAGKYVVSSGVMSGNLISAPEPAYPRMAKMWGIEGQVILQAVISSKGKVVAAHVLDGHKMLRGSAMNAVRKWRYKPYVVEGRPTDVATVVIVEYKLKP